MNTTTPTRYRRLRDAVSGASGVAAYLWRSITHTVRAVGTGLLLLLIAFLMAHPIAAFAGLLFGFATSVGIAGCIAFVPSCR